jgi:predicted nucleotidyltransferase component of viral defense system
VTPTTTGLARSVHDRLIAHAKVVSLDSTLVLTRFALERFLYRVSVSRYADRFVLKGGLLMLAWLGETLRPTRDADFLGLDAMDDDTLAAAFGDIVVTPVPPDGVTFDAATIIVEPIRAEDAYGGRRVTFEARLGNARIPVQVDVGFGDAMTPGPEWRDYPALLDFPAPRLKAYNKETLIAEKLHALVVLGLRNSRMRDFHDVYELQTRGSFKGASLVRAVRQTFKRRRTEIPAERPVGLTEAFARMPETKTRWLAYLRRNNLSDATTEFGEMVVVVGRFLVPVIEAACTGGAFDFTWEDGGSWRA